jgi:pimeloyl-ACP methyl ester carboxylesterase
MGCQIVTELAVRLPARRTHGAHRSDGRSAAALGPSPTLRGAAQCGAGTTIAAGPGRPRRRRFGAGALLATARSALDDRIDARLPPITQPTVVVRGENDGFVGQGWAETAAALLPRSRLVVVPGEPHAVHYTRPDLVAGIVDQFLVEEGEGEQAGSQLPRRLPHRHMPAPEADVARGMRTRRFIKDRSVTRAVDPVVELRWMAIAVR